MTKHNSFCRFRKRMLQVAERVGQWVGRLDPPPPQDLLQQFLTSDPTDYRRVDDNDETD